MPLTCKMRELDCYNILNKTINNDIIDTTISQEFLNNFLENEYSPCFMGVKRPALLDDHRGSSIDNIFIKTNEFRFNAYTRREVRTAVDRSHRARTLQHHLTLLDVSTVNGARMSLHSARTV